MLLSSVATKTVRDRTPITLGIGAGLGLLALAMVSVAASFEDDMAGMFDDLPDAFTGIIGGSGGNYVITEVFGLIAPIAVLVLAIGGGIGAIAREERDRTADLLLTHPVTRRRVVVSKSLVLVAHVGAACIIFLAGATVGAVLVDVAGFGPGDALAATVHLFFLGLAFGMIALAAGTLTGSTSAGMGIAAGLAVASNLVAGVVPLIDGLDDIARLSPWYYFNGAEPLTRGVAPGHLAVLGGLAVAALAVALVAVDHRDIGARRSGPRLKIPAVGTLVRPRVSGVFVKTLSERAVLVNVTGISLAAMAVTMSAMYTGIKDSLAELSDAFPDSVADLIGTANFSTPAGWIQAEMLSMIVPFALVAVGAVIGVGAIAGEDARRTLSLLVTTPIKRSRIVLEKAAAIVAAVIVAAGMCWLGLVAGSAIGGLDLSTAQLAAAMAHMALLGIFFGVLALAIGAAAGKTAALRAVVALAFAAYLGEWLLSLQDDLEAFAVLSPWHYVNTAQPLINGVAPLHLSVLAVASAITVAVAVQLFEHRELAA
ncbi:MAG: ABC transporter permease [Acidimicrobiia bacterium]|nr:ABC transporter permease [Acidimicrobiia bacterium]